LGSTRISSMSLIVASSVKLKPANDHLIIIP
jgi:hypothetical protein